MAPCSFNTFFCITVAVDVTVWNVRDSTIELCNNAAFVEQFHTSCKDNRSHLE